MKKRVMHVLKTNSFSGAENVVISIITHMDDKYEFYYVSRQGPIEKMLKKNNINFVPINNLSITEIRKVIKKINPDFVHAHDFTASIICAIACIHIPVISHIHNNVPWLKKYHPKTFLYLFSSFFYKKICVVSPSVLSEYIFGEFIRGKSLVIYNPVDIKSIEKKSDNSLYDSQYDIVFIGRLTEQKDPIRFIQIINNIVSKIPNVKCAMIGAGELESACIKEISRYKLESNIEMLGFVENPYGILKSGKILCITSKWEGYGLVAIEALALSVPVVSTNVGGLITIVNNECGKICNSDNEFIVEIDKLLNDKKYYQNKMVKAYERAQKLQNVNEYMDKLDIIYKQNCL